MKRLILMMAMLAVVVSAQTVMAGNDYLYFFQKFETEQAQQRKIDADLNKLDKQATVDLRGVAVPDGKHVSPRGTAAGKSSDK